jgi:predicted PurR-regulated permease PerM
VSEGRGAGSISQGESPDVEPQAVAGQEVAEEAGGIGSPSSVSAPVRARFKSMARPSGPFWIALLLVVLCAIIFMISVSALFVFGVGVALAFFLVPVVGWLERHGIPRWIAAILAVMTTLLTVLAMVAVVAFIIVNQGIAFLNHLPTIIDDLKETYAAMHLPDWVRTAVDSIVATIDERLQTLGQGAIVASVIGGVFNLLGGLFVWFLLPFFLFYLLKDQPRMSKAFYLRVPAPWEADVSKLLTISVGNFAQYFKAEFLVGGIMFVIVSIGMFVIGSIFDSPLLMEFALLLGLVAFVMELIPQIGPILSYIPALLVAIPSGFDVVAVVSIFYFIVFNIEGSILVPSLEGKMINFTGASVLVLIAIGFAVAGILGAILALPVASIIRDLFRYFFDKAVAEDLVYEAMPPSAPSPNTGSIP